VPRPAVTRPAMSDTAGCFGKVPQLGDFVSSRLPQTFTAPWDEFLSELMVFSREQLGDSWLDTYLNAPIWRFALAADCMGPDPITGTLMPSVDSVGRYFPLTIAIAVPSVAAAPCSDPWFSEAESLSLETLALDFDPGTLPDRLEKLGQPHCDPSAGHSGMLWWTLGARALEPLALRSSVLPRRKTASVLLDGDWKRWGWDAEPVPFTPREDEVPGSDG